MRPTRSLLPLALLALTLTYSTPVPAHEGHDQAPGAAAASAAVGRTVRVTETARQNLGLETAPAELRSIEQAIIAIGEIQAEPGRSATVASRIAGRVLAIYAKEGEQVKRGQSLVEIESLQLGDPPPRARYATPITGIVTDRHVVVGDDVEPSGHLFEIADLSEVLAVGRVFEGQIGQVAVGQKVRVRVPSYPAIAFEGVVERLGGKLDPVSRSLPVFVRVANPDTTLRPHMRAMLSLVTERADLALAIPSSSVLGEFGNPFVFVKREDAPDLFEQRPVVTGLSDDRFVEILEGVLPGERVVTEGSYSLQYLPEAAKPGEASEPAGRDGADTATDTRAAETAGPRLPTGWSWAMGIGVTAILALAGWISLRGRRARARER